MVRTDDGRKWLLYDFEGPVPAGTIALADGVTLHPFLEVLWPAVLTVKGLSRCF